MAQLMQRLWSRFALSGVHYGDRHGQLEMLYRVEDPWNMGSEREQFRFRETNRVLEATFGKVETLLEIGCGEGHQSQHLGQLAKRLTGLDVSQNAVERAKKRMAHADFEAADLFVSAAVTRQLQSAGPFDLAVAAEVLYYMKDPAAFVARMNAVARHCAVSYYARHKDTLDALFCDVEGASFTDIRHGDTSWTIVCWDSVTGSR